VFFSIYINQQIRRMEEAVDKDAELVFGPAKKNCHSALLLATHAYLDSNLMGRSVNQGPRKLEECFYFRLDGSA
jgi:hypothetical protein